MATVTTIVDSTLYVQITSGVDGLIQNTGTTDILLIFAASLPAVGATNYHVLKANDSQGLQVVNTVPSGNAYCRAYSNTLIGRVAFSG